MSSAAVGLGAWLAGRLFKKHHDGEKRGLLSTILSGISFFSQIKSFLNRVKTSTNEPA
jgi:hypothetical protein